jgi:hypothetical protein
VTVAVDVAIPERGYLRAYTEFASAGTMAPPEFHLACGLAQMATLLSNRVVFELGRHPYPAALWLVLLGKAGTKKSSAISLATHLLDMATDGKYRLPKEATRESLFSLLGARPTGYMPMSEFLGFLERSKLEYMSAIKEDLCDIFDHPAKMERRLQSGSTYVSWPAVTIMGAAVTDSLAEWVRRKDLAGGFLSRFLFIPQVSPVTYIGLDSKGPDPREDDLIAGLIRAKHMVPTQTHHVRIPPDARKVWEDYDKPMTEADVPVEFSGFANRLGLYALKLSLCYALAEGRLEPSKEDMWNAIMFVEFSRTQVEDLVQNVFTGSKEGAELFKLRDLMTRMANGHPEGWLDRRDVLRRSHLKVWNFDRVMETLEATGEVETDTVKPETGPARQRVKLVTEGRDGL